MWAMDEICAEVGSTGTLSFYSDIRSWSGIEFLEDIVICLRATGCCFGKRRRNGDNGGRRGADVVLDPCRRSDRSAREVSACRRLAPKRPSYARTSHRGRRLRPMPSISFKIPLMLRFSLITVPTYLSLSLNVVCNCVEVILFSAQCIFYVESVNLSNVSFGLPLTVNIIYAAEISRSLISRSPVETHWERKDAGVCIFAERERERERDYVQQNVSRYPPE